jgi:hypothetical protein
MTSGFLGVGIGLLWTVAALAQSAAVAEPKPEAAGVKPRAVLELFTSQGCSSCPAADALFVELARDPSLLVLTLPVDYWDYLGWKDTLAHAAFSQRQRLYAKTRGDGQIYTPQAVIDGAAHTVGSDRHAMEQILIAHRATPLPLDVAVTEHGDQMRVTISELSSLSVSPFFSISMSSGAPSAAIGSRTETARRPVASWSMPSHSTTRPAPSRKCSRIACPVSCPPCSASMSRAVSTLSPSYCRYFGHTVSTSAGSPAHEIVQPAATTVARPIISSGPVTVGTSA